MRIHHHLIPAVVLAVLPLSGANAGLTGVSVGAGLWSQDPHGHMESDGNRADVEDDLQIGS